MNIVKLLVSVGGSLLAGFVGSLYTMGSIDTWYVTLNKPFFNPPNWVFAPVWTTLYILMGVAAYIVWTNESKKKKIKDARCNGLRLFIIQVMLNTIWSILFFGLQNLWLAYAEMLVLLYFIILNIREFRKVSSVAAYLMYPYVAWVSFASILNLTIALMN